MRSESEQKLEIGTQIYKQKICQNISVDFKVVLTVTQFVF